MNNRNFGRKSFLLASICAFAAIGACKPAANTAAKTSSNLWHTLSDTGFNSSKNQTDGITYFSTEREIAVEGGGAVKFEASCYYKTDTDAKTNDFWIKLSGSPKDKDGMMAALDEAKLQTQGSSDDKTATLTSVRSSGEAGSILVSMPLGSDFFYENNQTADYAEGNLDPTKIEFPQKLTIPFADGRSPVLSLDTNDKGFQEMLAACKASKPA